MMRRLTFAAAPLLLLAGIACGDGPDKEETTPTAEAAAATNTPNSNEQPQVPDKPLPTPTPLPSDLPVVQVAFGGKQFAPTRDEFNGLPKTSIQANGKTYEGVTLATLAEKAGAGGASTATIQGTRIDNLRLGAIRFPMADIGASTVFVVDEGGHVLLASTSVPPEQWLKDITGIALN